jgi:hypothetical protein
VAPSDSELPADRLKHVELFPRLGAALNQAGVRFVVIGVAGANLWARSGQTIFATRDYDLFLPPDPENVLLAWQAVDALGLRLFCRDEPLDRPRDLFLAQRIIERRALVRASDGAGSTSISRWQWPASNSRMSSRGGACSMSRACRSAWPSFGTSWRRGGDGS